MAGRIRQDDIDAVRQRTDLIRLAQQYVALKKAGQRYVGLCPFHTEKTPSFGISPDKQLFYCHGCGKGGDAIHFLREIEGLDFAEAVERLASQAGVTIRYEGASPGERRAAGRRQALHAANEKAAELYHRTLLEGAEGEGARLYLADRGLTKESIEAFGIGFAPGQPDFLLKRLARDLSTEILVEGGLALKDARGQVRDRFRARITFPIHDLSGKGVGFGARLLEGDGPKYMNSPETPIYRKGELLYNLHRAKSDLTKTGRAFVVEGYTDVIALAQAGIATAVATCGTALSEGHFRLLSRFCRRAILSFDSDEAGARAAERAHGMFEQFGLEVSVLILPEGKDPADFVIENGGEEFERMADKAQPVVEYMLERAVRGTDLSTPEGQSQAVRAGLPIVDGLQDEVLRSRYTGVLAGLAGVSDTVVKRELERRPREGRSAAARPADQVEVRTPAKGVEKEVLKILAQHPNAAAWVSTEDIGDEHFTTERFRKAWALLRERPKDPVSLAEENAERGMPELIAELSVEPLRGDPVPSYVERVFARLEELTLKRKMDTLRKRLESLNPVTDAPTFDPLFSELSELTGRWRAAKARSDEGT
ncbi:MAG: DNA primase [Actinomycetota bacterium]